MTSRSLARGRSTRRRTSGFDFSRLVSTSVTAPSGSHRLDELPRDTVQLLHLRATDADLDRLLAEGAGLGQAVGHPGNLGDHAPGLAQDLAEGLSLAVLLQLHEGASFGHGQVGGPSLSDDGVGVVDVGERLEATDHLFRPFARLPQRGPRRGLEGDLVLAPVEVGHEVAAEDLQDREARQERGQGDGDHDGAMVQRPGQEPLVLHVKVVEPAVEPLQAPVEEVAGALLSPFDVGVVPARGEHRVEGEGDEEGDEHRERHGDAELVEEAPHDPAHEGHRDEDGEDGERGGEDGEADLARAVAGGVEWSLPAPGGARCSRAPRWRRRSGSRWRARGAISVMVFSVKPKA